MNFFSMPRQDATARARILPGRSSRPWHTAAWFHYDGISATVCPNHGHPDNLCPLCFLYRGGTRSLKPYFRVFCNVFDYRLVAGDNPRVFTTGLFLFRLIDGLNLDRDGRDLIVDNHSGHVFPDYSGSRVADPGDFASEFPFDDVVARAADLRRFVVRRTPLGFMPRRPSARWHSQQSDCHDTVQKIYKYGL